MNQWISMEMEVKTVISCWTVGNKRSRKDFAKFVEVWGKTGEIGSTLARFGGKNDFQNCQYQNIFLALKERMSPKEAIFGENIGFLIRRNFLEIFNRNFVTNQNPIMNVTLKNAFSLYLWK